MNYNLPFLPERSAKPRSSGLTMVMDKGLSLRETENMISSSSEFIDYVKFGFGTSLITNNLKEKIKILRQADITPFFGGTLFEAFIIRGLFDDFCRFLDAYKMEVAEISDGSISIPHNEKLEYIHKISSHVKVLSEVGSKLAGVHISTESWIGMMKSELDAGAVKVIAEAREAGNVGIYNADGSTNKDLVNSIISQIKSEHIIWEAPNKPQQVWFIKLVGHHVNLGNIASNDIIPLETLRLGLRGDTFLDFLPEDIKQKFSPL